MQEESTRSAFDQTLRESVAHGRLDEGLAQLSRLARTREDALTLAYLFAQRGDYERALGLLQPSAWGGELDSAMLRARGSALWHAGRLTDALHDFDAAAASAATETEQQAIGAEVSALHDEIATMRRVDESLTRLDIATLVVVVVLIAAVGEAHRRLFRTRSSPIGHV
jgi:hypothetical protein